MHEEPVPNIWEYSTIGWDASGNKYNTVGTRITEKCNKGWEFICGNFVGDGGVWYYSATFRRPKTNLQD